MGSSWCSCSTTAPKSRTLSCPRHGAIAMCGAFGGIAYELLLRSGAIELPHRVRAEDAKRYTHAPVHSLIALGIFGRAIVGAAAALTLLFVVAPTTAHSAIAMSVTAGAAAP